ncbi:MAG: tRNA preQ1(34) S-adenosylmethionine ribosyltransferase-isomerase QueA [Desulfovibrionaceae bacterium]
MNRVPDDFQLRSYRYELAPERIAQHPADAREDSRLLLLDRRSGCVREHAFTDLPDLLPPGALLAANNTRVLPARILGVRSTGGKVELLPLEPAPMIQDRAETVDGVCRARALCLLKSSKRLKAGELLSFPGGLTAAPVDFQEYGRAVVGLAWPGSLVEVFEEHGHMPLPPYIRREDAAGDRERYQTVYARADKAGAVAAPTAGLHFTQALQDHLAERGFGWTELTLHVGYGTFSPVRCADIREHAMHAEHVEVSEQAAEEVNRAKAEGRPVVAVGTTSARTLEGVHQKLGEIRPFRGLVDIYIRPGYQFRAVDHLLTNFHLPESSLLIMVSALAGRKRVLAAYNEALQRGFSFFSYGDAMLIR